MKEILDLPEEFYRKHLTFTSVKVIKCMIAPLEKIGINYFTFDRTYTDGSHIRLTSAGKWIEDYYREGLYKKAIFEKNPLLFRTGHVLWSWLKREPIYSAAADHDIDNGITIIEKHEKHTSFFHFGTSCHTPISPDDLVAQLGILYLFIASFKEKAHDLIEKAEQDRVKLIIPAVEEIKLEYLVTELNNTNIAEAIKNMSVSRLYLGEDFDDVYLTPRELEVLWTMKEGRGLKKVAIELNISIRTLQTHINSIRVKLRCKTMFELGYLLGTLGLKNIYPFKLQEQLNEGIIL